MPPPTPNDKFGALRIILECFHVLHLYAYFFDDTQVCKVMFSLACACSRRSLGGWVSKREDEYAKGVIIQEGLWVC